MFVKNRASSASSGSDFGAACSPAAGGGVVANVAAIDEETETLDEEPRNIIMGIIAQLRKGMDLHRVTLPTFVLEPRSMCERISDFMIHQDLIMSTPAKDDPTQRMIDVLRYFLSGWHIRPKGVKKPFNPVLGEIFRCRWTLEDGTESVYVCEQVSHHPPVSAYYYANPENGVRITGECKPRARFLGNSAATMMEGGSTVSFSAHPGEVYDIVAPNIYARGILFGTMYMELGDTATVRCAKTDLVCTVDFKTKGYFGGSEANAIAGKLKRESTGEVLYKIAGKWSDQMWLHAPKSDKTNLLFDAHNAKSAQMLVEETAAQEEFESRRLWQNVANAVVSRDMNAATDEKSKIEDNQRVIVKAREESNQPWESRFFVPEGEGWAFKFLQDIPKEPTEARNWLREMIFKKTDNPMHAKFWASPHLQGAASATSAGSQ
ncbi:hypothetical protein BC831DRAFT_471286 [Entophlyctis helioformis]|nr:hypothetical protein BC831DRAFT_471286 [Entophlyctis helioformis]